VRTGDGEEIINAFLQSPSNTKIPAWLRKAVKDHQWFLPRAATSTRELALEILKTISSGLYRVRRVAPLARLPLVDGRIVYRCGSAARARNQKRSSLTLRRASVRLAGG